MQMHNGIIRMIEEDREERAEGARKRQSHRQSTGVLLFFTHARLTAWRIVWYIDIHIVKQCKTL